MSPVPQFGRRRAVLGLGAALTLAAGAARSPDAGSRPVVEALAGLAEREYPDVQLAAQMARTLRAKLRAGAYRDLATTALAQALTADLRAVARDEHLTVTYDPVEAATRTAVDAPPQPAAPPTRASPGPRAREVFEPQAYGVAAIRRLNGNIGLLTIDNFPPLYDLVKARYGAAMSLLSDTWGLIVDLRTNGGGAGDSPGELMSYFFDREPFVLSRVEWRRYPTEEARTTRALAGPNYGELRPVFVTVSSETFSAAEWVAYELQAHGRAAVVGQRTRGGGNPGDFFNLGSGFEAFMPQGRGYCVATGRSWEGTGVLPDIAAEPGATLRAAHRAAVNAALAQTRDTERISVLRAALEAGPGDEPG